MANYQEYMQYADETALSLTRSSQNWTAFLTTAARLYKYPYNEQLMIYAQRPDSLDFQVTPHQLRHTYITNLIHASVDPKTVQYLAGHESSKITMDIYAKVKYNNGIVCFLIKQHRIFLFAGLGVLKRTDLS